MKYKKIKYVCTLLVVISGFCLLVTFNIVGTNVYEKSYDLNRTTSKKLLVNEKSLEKNSSGYLILTPQCRIQNLDPFAKDVMKLFKREKFVPCSSEMPLTSIKQDFEHNNVTLLLHEDRIAKYVSKGEGLKCCYKEITRNKNADSAFSLSKCVYFEKTTRLSQHVQFILVECTINDKNNDKLIYSNAHAIVQKTAIVSENLKNSDNMNSVGQRPLNVLMVGIDSISRLNLIRAMPDTYNYLQDNDWFELRGYNKIDDNTFPNLMAILAGYNRTLTDKNCDSVKVGGLDKCPLIWKYFQDVGYVTGFAEDEAKINTFNNNKAGFVEQPVTHYFRPFALAAEKYIKKRLKSSLVYCLGFQTYADFIYQYAVDFASTYKNDPFFGLFWTNTFSHNDISDPSSMDSKIKDYLVMMEERGVLNTSMVVFFSDHGLRFGKVRELYTGWLEERLPFIYIWLPDWFRKKYPDLAENLRNNRDKLTNPYDLHNTLKHIIELSGRMNNLPKSESCPNCQSLLNEIPSNRSCSDVSISNHWCTCSSYEKFNKSEQVIKDALKFTVTNINTEVQKRLTDKKLCAILKLKNILSARIGVKTSESFQDYLITFDVSPSNGKFEATIRHHILENKFEKLGFISRLNMYSTQSYCVNTDFLRKFCFCSKKRK